MKLFTKKIQRSLKSYSLRIDDFYEKRYKILIHRGLGGAGDILMHRMIFEDFKVMCPKAEITFAIPPQFFPLATFHPFIDKVVNYRNYNPQEYMLRYDTTSSCIRYELGMIAGKLHPKNRPDIWAESCGINLTKHNMHMNLPEEIINIGKEELKKINLEGKPSVLISPISMSGHRNIEDKKWHVVVKRLKEKGCFVYGTNMIPHPIFEQIGVPSFHKDLEHWMAIVSAADYVVSVDTGTFHLAGGLKKPMMGIFTYIDGKVRGCYYDFVLVQKHKDNGYWDCGPCWSGNKCPKSKELLKPCATEMSDTMLVDGIDKMFDKWPNG